MGLGVSLDVPCDTAVEGLMGIATCHLGFEGFGGQGFFFIGVAHSGVACPLVPWSSGPLLWSPVPLASWSAGLWLRLLEGYEYCKKLARNSLWSF